MTHIMQRRDTAANWLLTKTRTPPTVLLTVSVLPTTWAAVLRLLAVSPSVTMTASARSWTLAS